MSRAADEAKKLSKWISAASYCSTYSLYVGGKIDSNIVVYMRKRTQAQGGGHEGTLNGKGRVGVTGSGKVHRNWAKKFSEKFAQFSDISSTKMAERKILLLGGEDKGIYSQTGTKDFRERY